MISSPTREPGIEGAKLSEHDEMTPDALLLRQLIRFNEPAAPVAIPAMLLLYWIYPDTVILILAASVVPTFVLQRFAVHYALRNRVAEGHFGQRDHPGCLLH